MISYSEAKQLVVQNITSFDTYTVSIEEAYGKVLAEDIVADRDYPPFHRSAMDGYAVQSKDWLSGKRSFTVVGELLAGGVWESQEVKEGEVITIMTGAAVPTPFDLVIKVEDGQRDGNQVTFLDLEEVKPGVNIAVQGEDVQKDKVLVKKGTKVNHAVLGALATVGKAEVLVVKTPKVAIISTGDEVKGVGEDVSPVQIRNSNAYVLLGLLKDIGVEDVHHQLIEDDKALLEAAYQGVADYDLVLFTGGVSMGEADFIPHILADNGVEKIFHRVAIKPGKPIWFGKSSAGKTVFGLPGNPLSSQVTFRLFVQTWILGSLGLNTSFDKNLPMANDRVKKGRLAHFFPAAITINGEVLPISLNGSGDITATLKSDGLFCHPSEVEKLEKGNLVDFLPWS